MNMMAATQTAVGYGTGFVVVLLVICVGLYLLVRDH